MAKQYPKTTPKKATSKEPRAGRKGGPNKSSFIREQPDTMSAREVVETAAAQGIVLTEGFVYNVRSNAKKASSAEAAPTTKEAPVKAPRPKAVKSAASSDESSFRALVVALGTTKARELVEEVEAKLAALVDGF